MIRDIDENQYLRLTELVSSSWYIIAPIDGIHIDKAIIYILSIRDYLRKKRTRKYTLLSDKNIYRIYSLFSLSDHRISHSICSPPSSSFSNILRGKKKKNYRYREKNRATDRFLLQRTHQLIEFKFETHIYIYIHIRLLIAISIAITKLDTLYES